MNALANPEVGKLIEKHFVSSFQRVGTFRIVGQQKQGGNVATYFCAPDGRVLDRISVPGRRGVACVLGGEDRKTLFCVSMDPDRGSEAGPKPQSYVDAAVVEVPGAGYP